MENTQIDEVVSQPAEPGGAAPEQPSNKPSRDEGANQGLFSQEQLNKILAEERRKAEARAQRKIEEAQKAVAESYEQKLSELLAKLGSIEQSLKEKEELAQKAVQEAERARREAQVASLAAKLGVKAEAVPDVVRLFEPQGDNLEESLKNFLESRPYYLAERQQAKPVSRINATNPAASNSGVLDWHPLIRITNGTSIFGGS